MGVADDEFAGVLDDDDAVERVDEAEEGAEEDGFAGAGAPGDEDVRP
ncbi:Uncharacterised protein [Mycobacteroides abscessus subsp. abscessus]|nr:Uncharacterised protein [Mycobacteroides abscessus subsp. abscessus]